MDNMATCVAMSGKCRTSDLDITGLRPPVAKDTCVAS